MVSRADPPFTARKWRTDSHGAGLPRRRNFKNPASRIKAKTCCSPDGRARAAANSPRRATESRVYTRVPASDVTHRRPPHSATSGAWCGGWRPSSLKTVRRSCEAPSAARGAAGGQLTFR